MINVTATICASVIDITFIAGVSLQDIKDWFSDEIAADSDAVVAITPKSDDPQFVTWRQPDVGTVCASLEGKVVVVQALFEKNIEHWMKELDLPVMSTTDFIPPDMNERLTNFMRNFQ